MSNDSGLLHQTAPLLRSRAKAATPGPWQVNVDNHRGFEVPDVSVWSETAGEYVTEDVVTTPDSHFLANAEHVATWTPEAALAVADFLEFASHYANQPQPYSPTVEHALKIARALGVGEEGEPEDSDPCPHDWTLRPESDTWVCEDCGTER